LELTLESFADTTVSIALFIPPDALPGTINIITLTATSQTNPTFDDSDRLTVKVLSRFQVKGDVNNDGTVNILDVVLAVNIILDIEFPTANGFRAADCNGDRGVNILDVVGIVNSILEIAECEP